MSIDICDELHQNFIDFSYEANSQRAFADARDGLKPGQRACLWEFFTKGYLSNKPHVKSAKVSGGVIASWWPHGDVAIYETFARMSQNWINNIPEVSWHGANGNIVIGSAPASARYTEARLSKAAEEGLFQGIKKNNVPMILNFSEDEEWPEVLPAIMPRLLINGCQGIGVTIANCWLNNNLIEVGNAIKNYINTNKIDNNSVYPDFPSGGIIINKNDLHIINETGKGKVVVRAKTEVKNNTIYITELPYQVYVEPIIENIKELITKDELTGVKNIYNKSDKNKLLIEIECDNDANSVLKKLFKNTDLQKNFNANQYALVGKTPKLLNLKEYFDIYIEHNIQCIKKEYEFDLTKAQARKEIIEGLLKALEDIDNIITLIKKSDSAAAAKINLINKYSFTENQAKAIVDMKLGRLAHLEYVELNNENQELENNIKEYNFILSNKQEIIKILVDRLDTFVKKYGTSRKTELLQIDIKPEDKEIAEITPENCIVILSQSGNIKRIPSNNFKVQKRNGKGIKSEDDAILDTIATNTVDNLMIFTNKGKMYKLLVDNVPVGTNLSKGVSIASLVNLEPNEKAIAITSLNKQNDAKYIIFITKKGLLKKTYLEEYTKVKRSSGIAAIKLNKDDTIANVFFANEEEVIIITKKGMSIHFETKDISPIGRVTAGVKTIKLNEDDEVLVGLPIQNPKAEVAIFTEKGFGKKTSIDEFPLQLRAGKGVSVYKSTDTSGNLAGAVLVTDENNILLVGKPNSICISATDLPNLSRVGIGNTILKSDIKSIVKI